MSLQRSKRSRRTGTRRWANHVGPDSKVWIAYGIVEDTDESGSHFEIADGDVVVDVVLQPSEAPIRARLSGHLWGIPAIDSEVLVAMPEGDLTADPVIIAHLTGGTVADGLDETTRVIVVQSGAKVLIHDGTASEAVELATKADVDAIEAFQKKHWDTVLGHTHSGVTTGAGASGPPVVGTGAGSGFSVPSAAGTAVLKAK